MSNDVVEFGQGAVGNFLAGAQEFKKVAPRTKSGGGEYYIKLRSSDGAWVYGKEEIEVEDGAQLLIGADTIVQGFIAWKAGRPIGEEMALIGTPPIDPSSLPPVDCKGGWEEQVGWHMKIMTGEDEGTQVLWRSNNTGGKDAFNATFDAMMARAAAGKPFNPVVELQNDSYIHSDHGKIFKPIFKIIDWMGDVATAVEAPEEEIVEAEPVEDEKPKRRRRG